MRQFNGQLSLKLSGEGISPSSLSVSDLAEMIIAHEKALLAEMEKSGDQFLEEEKMLSLIGIQEGSVQLDFYPHSPYFQTAHATIASAIVQQTFDRLSSKARNCLNDIQKIVKKRGMVAEFYDGQEVIATITPETNIAVEETLYIEGETTLYGKIERVGGMEPTVRLRLSEREVLTCKINQPLAIELASYLYQWVNLNGKAKWNVQDCTVEAFEIININKDFQDIPLNEAFSHLSQEMGHYFDDIDPVEYIKNERNGD